MERAEWLPRAEAHAARVDAWTEPHLARRRRGVKHPVHDFLFDYYSHRPAALRRWHPGAGVVLLDAPEYADLKGYAATVRDVRPDISGTAPAERHGLSVSADVLKDKSDLVRQIHDLLVATAARAPLTGCFGLHEWAMVHRARESGGTRHDVPLRLGPDGTDTVVESHRIACTHFDAFRFFTPSARSLNTLSPGRDDRADFEQPGCLHAGMDLYGRHAARLSPLVPSDLVADAFELAWEIRIVDMRASPYDFTGLTLDPNDVPWTPIKIETTEGKREYVDLQRQFTERARPIRRRLIDQCALLARLGTSRQSEELTAGDDPSRTAWPT